ncbi:hypothetical protein F4804DRAFT_175377 [Jackrogersella minutella]|nr:hypothetical protein F4804DRAFT_175377 [Jackrogersella minutella]
MASQSPQSRYGLSCPSGGSFYICQTSPTRFLGCCETDPCSSGGSCAADSLRAASYASYPGGAQSCAAPAGEWYTCDFATPRFMGCCARDPCDAGCPAADLVPARLDDDDAVAAPFLVQVARSSVGSTSVQTASPTTTGAGGEASSSGGIAGEPSHIPASRYTGLIVGLSTAAILVLLLVMGVAICWRRRNNVWDYNGKGRHAFGSRGGENYNRHGWRTCEYG